MIPEMQPQQGRKKTSANAAIFAQEKKQCSLWDVDFEIDLR